MNNRLDNFTLIISSLNRPNHLRRILTYLEMVEASFSILIIDSSSVRYKEQIEVLCKKSPLDIEFIHKNNSPSFYQKLFYAAQQVATDYCMWCSEDDFPLPFMIKKGIAFLKNHEDYSCVRGTFYNYFLRNKDKQICWLPVSDMQSLQYASPAQRINTSILQQRSLIYSVFRTKTFRAVFKEASAYEVHPKFFLLHESFQGALYPLFGKVKIIYYPSLFKEFEGASWGQSFPHIKTIIHQASFKKHQIYFQKRIVTLLINHGVSKEEAVMAAAQWMEQVVQYQYDFDNSREKQPARSQQQKWTFLRKMFAGFLPSWIKSIIQKCEVYLKKTEMDQDLDKHKKLLFDQQNNYKEELNAVNYTIKKAGFGVQKEDTRMVWQVW